MANILLAWPNRADAATLSGGAWSESLPLANLQNRLLSKVGRSTDWSNDSTWLDIDEGASLKTRIVALVGHTCSPVARIRIRASDDPEFLAADIYDSGWLSVWPSVYTMEQVEWEDDNWWSGQLTDEEMAGLTATFVHLLPAATYARHKRVLIDDTLNADGYVQIGRLFIGDGWQPALNMSYGASIGWETDTVVEKSLDGVEFFDTRQPYRVARVRLDWLDTDEAFGRAFELQRRSGISGEVLYMWNPDDTLHAQRRTFMARLRALSAIEHPYFDINKLALEVKEIQ